MGELQKNLLVSWRKWYGTWVGGAHSSIQDQGKGGALYFLLVVASIGHSETFNSVQIFGEMFLRTVKQLLHSTQRLMLFCGR